MSNHDKGLQAATKAVMEHHEHRIVEFNAAEIAEDAIEAYLAEMSKDAPEPDTTERRKPMFPRWEPIRTAPKDYKEYLFLAESGIRRVDGYKEARQPNTGRRWREHEDNQYTHWMPLPEPYV